MSHDTALDTDVLVVGAGRTPRDVNVRIDDGPAHTVPVLVPDETPGGAEVPLLIHQDRDRAGDAPQMRGVARKTILQFGQSAGQLGRAD
jgi:hypothetical protein